MTLYNATKIVLFSIFLTIGIPFIWHLWVG